MTTELRKEKASRGGRAHTPGGAPHTAVHSMEAESSSYQPNGAATSYLTPPAAAMLSVPAATAAVTRLDSQRESSQPAGQPSRARTQSLSHPEVRGCSISFPDVLHSSLTINCDC